MSQKFAPIRAPATIGAASIATPVAGPNSATALSNSASSVKTSFIRPKPCGIISAPNAPCSTRNAISTPIVGATAHAAENSVKPAEPIRNSRRRPKMSPSRAPAIRNTANASV